MDLNALLPISDLPKTPSDWFAAGVAFEAMRNALAMSARNETALAVVERILSEIQRAEFEDLAHWATPG